MKREDKMLAAAVAASMIWLAAGFGLGWALFGLPFTWRVMVIVFAMAALRRLLLAGIVRIRKSMRTPGEKFIEELLEFKPKEEVKA